MARDISAGLYGTKDLTVGDCIPCGSLTVTTEHIDRFAELTGDRFEIHKSKDAAKRHGFDDRVAHGLLVLSLIDGMKNQAPAQIRSRASMGWDWTFRRPVLAGDTITVVFDITDINEARSADQAILTLDFTVTNQRGAIVQTGTNRLLAYRG